jgi:hypothetical protein
MRENLEIVFGKINKQKIIANMKIKCLGSGYYRVKMNDGKLFNICRYGIPYASGKPYSDTKTGMWRVYAGTKSTPEDRLGEFRTLKECKEAIVNDFANREYPDHKTIWYGTKWGNVHFDFLGE